MGSGPSKVEIKQMRDEFVAERRKTLSSNYDESQNQSTQIAMRAIMMDIRKRVEIDESTATLVRKGKQRHIFSSEEKCVVLYHFRDSLGKFLPHHPAAQFPAVTVGQHDVCYPKWPTDVQVVDQSAFKTKGCALTIYVNPPDKYQLKDAMKDFNDDG